ncbi:MAG: glycosyltransferase, partial [Flavobacteriales bacterium]|nr:glycosyltransferase [Flavobacteriales bacterium]
MKKVSIITVAWNSAETIQDTIESVIGQTYSNIEYIIVDGGSSDETVNIIKHFEEKISRWTSEPDDGIYDAMNKGIEMATGDYIGILNSDDFYADNTVVEDVMNLMTKSGNEALYADLVYVDRENTQKVVRTWKAGAYKV